MLMMLSAHPCSANGVPVMKRVIVQYKVKADRAAEFVDYVKNVFAALAALARRRLAIRNVLGRRRCVVHACRADQCMSARILSR